MNEILKKLKEANFNIIYNVYNTSSSNFIIDILFSFIEIFQNFGLIMNDLVYIQFNYYRQFQFGKKQIFYCLCYNFLNILDFYITLTIIKIYFFIQLYFFVF